MKRHYTFLSFLLVTSCFAATAQDKTQKADRQFNNSIKLHTGSFQMKYLGQRDFVTSFIGIYYERKVYNNIFLSAGFSRWRAPLERQFKSSYILLEVPSPSDTARNTLIERQGYKMIDFGAMYRQNLYKRKHFLKAGIGISYSWGTNKYIKERYWVYEHGWTGDDYYKNVNYWGIVPQISYDYNFFRNRINAGIDVRGRYYKNIPRAQYDLGIHMGINF